jgi:hypothetical protein
MEEMVMTSQTDPEYDLVSAKATISEVLNKTGLPWRDLKLYFRVNSIAGHDDYLALIGVITTGTSTELCIASHYDTTKSVDLLALKIASRLLRGLLKHYSHTPQAKDKKYAHLRLK